jgi:hypothetical protein
MWRAATKIMWRGWIARLIATYVIGYVAVDLVHVVATHVFAASGNYTLWLEIDVLVYWAVVYGVWRLFGNLTRRELAAEATRDTVADANGHVPPQKSKGT